MDPDRRLPPLALAAALGAAWGAIGYLILWGHIPAVFPSRQFVAGGVGTALFLPVRGVLLGIRALEGAAGRTFELADNNWWIGIVAALLGAVLVAVGFLGIRAGIRAWGRKRDTAPAG